MGRTDQTSCSWTWRGVRHICSPHRSQPALDPPAPTALASDVFSHRTAPHCTSAGTPRDAARARGASPPVAEPALAVLLALRLPPTLAPPQHHTTPTR